MTGVINYITDRNFNGLKFEGRYGISSHSDGEETSFGVAGGTGLFGGRGHFEGSYEYFNTPGIPSEQSRSWAMAGYSVQGAGTAANPYRLYKDSRINSTAFEGLIPGVGTANAGNPLRDMVFSSNGVLTPFQHGAPTVAAGIESGGGGGFYNSGSLESMLQSHLAFGRFDFDLTDDTHLYVAATGQLTHNSNFSLRDEFRNVTLSSTNAFLATQYQAAMTGAGRTTFTFSRMLPQTQDSESYTRGYMLDVTLAGKLGGYRWEAFFHPSQTSQETRNNYNISNYRASAALDATVVTAANVGSTGLQIGSTVCGVSLTNPGLYPGCVPLNLFGPTAESAAAIDYIMDETQFIAKYHMNEVGASIAGSPFSSWAGPVEMALTGGWHKLSYHLDSTAQAATGSCVGLRFNCGATTLLYAGNVLSTNPETSQSVSEGAIEANLPVLKDALLARSLSLSGAVRLAHYDTSGSATTWKLGMDWRINDQLTFRATRSRDIRAPSLVDLYQPLFFNTGGSTVDVHTGATVQAPQVTGANPNLKPEVGQVFTAGFVLKPNFLPRFSVSLDVFKITINNAIIGVGGNNTSVQNVCEASNGTSPYCDLIIRPLPFSDRSSANAATRFNIQPLNSLQQETYGADLELNYQMPLFGGNLALRGLTSYQPHLTTKLAGTADSDVAGAAHGACCMLFGIPQVQVVGFVKYTHGKFSVDLQERWQSGRDWLADRTILFAQPRLPSIAYTNLTLGYQLDKAQLYLSARNLFDRDPTVWARVSNSAQPGVQPFINGQDTIGRYVTAGVRVKL